jgi:hypothetical protein
MTFIKALARLDELSKRRSNGRSRRGQAEGPTNDTPTVLPTSKTSRHVPQGSAPNKRKRALEVPQRSNPLEHLGAFAGNYAVVIDPCSCPAPLRPGGTGPFLLPVWDEHCSRWALGFIYRDTMQVVLYNSCESQHGSEHIKRWFDSIFPHSSGFQLTREEVKIDSKDSDLRTRVAELCVISEEYVGLRASDSSFWSHLVTQVWSPEPDGWDTAKQTLASSWSSFDKATKQ